MAEETENQENPTPADRKIKKGQVKVRALRHLNEADSAHKPGTVFVTSSARAAALGALVAPVEE